RTRQIPAESRQVNARKNNLSVSRIYETACFLNDRAHWHAARISSSVGDDAEGAAVIATILDLQKSTRATFGIVDELRRRFPHRENVIDAHTLGGGHAEIPIIRSFELFEIAENEIDLRHLRIGTRVDLRRTSRDDDLRRWIGPTAAANGLPRLT